MLFACTKCHSRHPFEDLSKEEQLCKSCRRKYPLTPCQYCQMEYHIMKKVDGSPVCTKCTQNISSYGMPKACKYCQILAAFKTSYCARCISSRKKYGEPVPCQQCKKKCAFNKSGDSRAKVGGQILCLKCTLGYKKQKHQQQKLSKKDGTFDETPVHFSKPKVTPKMNKDYQSLSGSSDKLSNLGSTEKVIAPLKAENLAKTFKSRIIDSEARTDSRTNSPFINNTLSTPKQKSSPSDINSDSKLEPSFGDHMSEMTKLRDEIAMLKKIISQKDKVILAKDKKINEFNAEKWDLEKLQRQKLSVIQKDFETSLQKLRLENGDLRKQVSTLKKKKAKYDELSAKNAGKIRLGVFKAHSPAFTPTKSSLDSPSENTDSDSETKTRLKEVKKNEKDEAEGKIITIDDDKPHKDADEKVDEKDQQSNLQGKEDAEKDTESGKEQNVDIMDDVVSVKLEEPKEDEENMEEKGNLDEKEDENLTHTKDEDPDKSTEKCDESMDKIEESSGDIKKKRKRKHKLDVDDDDDEESVTDENKLKKKKISKLSDEEEESDESEKKTKSKRKGILSDDDSEDEAEKVEQTKENVGDDKADDMEDDIKSDDKIDNDINLEDVHDVEEKSNQDDNSDVDDKDSCNAKTVEDNEEAGECIDDTEGGADLELDESDKDEPKEEDENKESDSEQLDDALLDELKPLENEEELTFSNDEEIKSDTENTADTEESEAVKNDNDGDVSDASSCSGDELQVDEE